MQIFPFSEIPEKNSTYYWIDFFVMWAVKICCDFCEIWLKSIFRFSGTLEYEIYRNEIPDSIVRMIKHFEFRFGLCHNDESKKIQKSIRNKI